MSWISRSFTSNRAQAEAIVAEISALGAEAMAVQADVSQTEDIRRRANGNPLSDLPELRLDRAHYLVVDRGLVPQAAVDAFLQHHPRASVDRY